MRRALSLLLLLPVLLTGCMGVPTEAEELHSPKLMIAQDGDGLTRLVWQSRPDYLYTIYYRDGEQPWRELSAVRKVPGTGGSMEATDRVNPSRRVLRRYRLHFETP